MLSPVISRNFMHHLTDYATNLNGPEAEVAMIWTGETIATLPTATVDDAYAAIDEARASYPKWTKTSIAYKKRVLNQWVELIYRHKERLVQLSQILAGKCRLDAVDEFLDCLFSPREASRLLHKVHDDSTGFGVIPLMTKLRVKYDPLGVVGIFTLNDFPVSYGPVDVMQVLAAGNSVVQFVPAQAAPAAYALRELIEAAGLPRGVWQIVPAQDTSIGFDVIDQLDFVSFIGNTADGAYLGARCQEAFIPTAMFLSTKNQAVVFDDVEVDEIVPKVARAVYHMNGQGPCHVERIWVHRNVYQDFIERFEDYVRAEVRVGASWDHTCTIGSLYSEERFQRVETHVADAMQTGATLICGGRRRPDLGPWFYEPTVLANVSRDAMCYDEETYGPVVAIEVFDDIDKLEAELEKSQYGYHMVFFAKDVKKVRKLIESSAAGLFSINDAYHGMWGTYGMPLSGSRDTGDGVRHSIEGITQYMKSHSSIYMRWGTLDPTWTLSGKEYEDQLLGTARFRSVITHMFPWLPL